MKCEKKWYATRSDAKAMMRKLNTAGRSEKKLTDLYYCETCSGYHLTSQPKSLSRATKKKVNERKNSR